MGYVIDELFAFTAIDDEGNEGIISAEMKDMLIPLVFADLARLPDFAPIAEAISKGAGVKYKLKHFTLLGDVSDEYLDQYKDPPEPKPIDPPDSGSVH